MSALRVTMEAISLNSPVENRVVYLDCWKAEVWITTGFTPAEFTINGVPVPAQLFPRYDPVAAEFFNMPLTFGGMRDKQGMPVNLNQNLEFQITGRPMSVNVRRTYIDFHLDDPNR